MFPRNPPVRKVCRCKPSRKEPNSRLVLEPLESRTLLSVCTVDRLTDNNPAGGGEGGNGMGDLRWCAIESLFQADTIAFAVTGTINLAGALPTLTRGVNIDGPGTDLLTVRRDTGGNYRILTVASGVTASISGLTITNGAADGGGISNSGTLTVSNSTISGNTAIFSGSGGGVLNSGTLTVDNSTISGNSAGIGGGISGGGIMTISNSTISGNVASNLGGGIANGGATMVRNSTIAGNSAGFGAGIYNGSTSGPLTINNSTIANNSAAAQGGGIWNNIGMLTVSDTTIAGNSANADGGGIYVSSPMAARNSIITVNTAPAGPDVYGNFGSQGHNLLGNPQDASGWVDTDLLHVNARLGPLQDNGGPTRTMALPPSSPALNAGAPDQLGVPDQRGVVRSSGVNIGAFQASASAFIVNAPAKVTAGVPFDLTVTAVDPFGQVAVGYTGTATFGTTDPDPGVVLPADYTFTAADAGVHTFTDTGLGETTLITRGQQTVTATDAADGSITGSANVKVKHLRHHDDANGGVLASLKGAAIDPFFAAIREADFRFQVLPPDHRHAGIGSWEPNACR